MSHFTVLVIGDEPEAQLAPYHEFECTGFDDEYVQDLDITEDSREEFEKHTEERLRAPDGTLHSFFDERGEWRLQFSQPDTSVSFDSTRRKRLIPQGYEVVTVPTKNVESFADFIEGWSGQKVVSFGCEPDLEGEHKYGYVIVNAAAEVVKVIDRTNPNKKWDWHQLGGRWTGYFPVKNGKNFSVGRPGLQTDRAKVGYADQLRKADIDLDRLRNEKGEEARAEYRKVMTAVGNAPRPESWAHVRDRFGTDHSGARIFYNDQEWIKRKNEDRDLLWLDAEDFDCTEEEYVQRAKNRAGVPFAIVRDSKWYQKGRMGWWGCVSDEMDQDEWNRKVSEMLDEVPDNTLLSVYDCHI